MTTYEPGTVAVATVRGVENVRVMAGYGTAEPRLRWVTTDERLVDTDDDCWWFSYQVTDVRPLVVLDIDSLCDHIGEQERRDEVLKALRSRRDPAADFISNRRLSDAIEHQTSPPKPAEPTGLGALVEDRDGKRWVHAPAGDGDAFPWTYAAMQRSWASIDAVRVLSEGWSA